MVKCLRAAEAHKESESVSCCANSKFVEGTSSNLIVTNHSIVDLGQQRFEVKECVTGNLKTAAAYNVDLFDVCEDIGCLANGDVDLHN